MGWLGRWIVAFLALVSPLRVWGETLQIDPTVRFQATCDQTGSHIRILSSPAMRVTQVALTWPGAPAGYLGFTQLRPGTLTVTTNPGYPAVRIAIVGVNQECSGADIGIIHVSSPGPVYLYPFETGPGGVFTTRLIDCLGVQYTLFDIPPTGPGQCPTSDTPVSRDTWGLVKELYR